MKTCKNCGALTDNLYCGMCGQKPVPERISFHYIWHSLVHFFTHAEHGFFYTSWQLIVIPGRTVKNFIEGKRKAYQTPISYFLIWAAIYILILYIVDKSFGENRVIDFAEYFGPEEKTKFAVSNLNILLIFLLLFQALYVWFIMMFKDHNYFEALVVVLYSIGGLLMWQCVFVLLAILIYLVTGNSMNIQWSDIFKALYVGWFMMDLAKLLPIKFKLVRVVAVLLLVFGTFTAWRIFIIPSVAELFF